MFGHPQVAVVLPACHPRSPEILSGPQEPFAPVGIDSLTIGEHRRHPLFIPMFITHIPSNPSVNLHESLNLVNDRESFFAFIETLIDDRIDAAEKELEMSGNPYAGPANDWQDTTIESFLEAALAWAEAMPGQLDEAPSWQSFAHFFHAGKIYE